MRSSNQARSLFSFSMLSDRLTSLPLLPLLSRFAVVAQLGKGVQTDVGTLKSGTAPVSSLFH